jgi:predicted negative regulator of RcsB-dependent stress response
MDDDLSEKEQIEEIKSWVKSNWLSLVGGVGLGFVALFSWGWFQDYSFNNNLEASLTYENIATQFEDNNFTEGQSLLDELRASQPLSPYTDYAGLLYATYLLSDGLPQLAVDEITYVSNNTSDEYLKLVSLWRLARLNVELQNFDEALDLISNKDHQLSANFKELEADIYFFQGEAELARDTYLSVLSDPNINLVNLNTLMLKINNLSTELF